MLETQKLDGPITPDSVTEEPVIAESVGSDQPFDEDSIVEAVSLTDADDADQSFIEELDNSLAEEINRDQLKA